MPADDPDRLASVGLAAVAKRDVRGAGLPLVHRRRLIACLRDAVGAPIIEVLCLAQLALLATDEGDREEAIRLATRTRTEMERAGLSDVASMELVFAMSALVRAQDGNVADAGSDAQRSAALLQQLSDFAPWYQAETELVLARALLRLDDVETTRALLVDASRSLRGTPDATALREWLQDAWSAIDSSAADVASGRLGLTPAELRVLQFLPSHHSFREIAAELYVSANTIKTQARAPSSAET